MDTPSIEGASGSVHLVDRQGGIWPKSGAVQPRSIRRCPRVAASLFRYLYSPPTVEAKGEGKGTEAAGKPGIRARIGVDLLRLGTSSSANARLGGTQRPDEQVSHPGGSGDPSAVETCGASRRLCRKCALATARQRRCLHAGQQLLMMPISPRSTTVPVADRRGRAVNRPNPIVSSSQAVCATPTANVSSTWSTRYRSRASCCSPGGRIAGPSRLWAWPRYPRPDRTRLHPMLVP